MTQNTRLFGLTRCALVGMVHVQALPGSPGWRGDMSAVLDAAERDAEALASGGVDAIIVENMHDLPYLRGAVPPETTAGMALATARVAALGVPTGVQVLAAANREALAVAMTCGATFMRAEAFAYAHVADEGWLDASAGELLRARAALGADVKIWADVQKKHASHAVTADLTLPELAHGAAFCGADALVITGRRTGRAAAPADLEATRSVGLPLAVGSGVTEASSHAYAQRADALIVGTALKVDRDWRNPVDPARVAAMATAMRS